MRFNSELIVQESGYFFAANVVFSNWGNTSVASLDESPSKGMDGPAGHGPGTVTLHLKNLRNNWRTLTNCIGPRKRTKMARALLKTLRAGGMHIDVAEKIIKCATRVDPTRGLNAAEAVEELNELGINLNKKVLYRSARKLGGRDFDTFIDAAGNIGPDLKSPILKLKIRHYGTTVCYFLEKITSSKSAVAL